MRKAMSRHLIHNLLGWVAVIATVGYSHRLPSIIEWWDGAGLGGVLGVLVGGAVFVAPWICILMLLHYHTETSDSAAAQ